jgi:hypothetical protein
MAICQNLNKTVILLKGEKMKKEIGKKPVFKNVVSHYEEEIFYVAKDGSKYKSELEAENHEKHIEWLVRWNAIKKADFDGSIPLSFDDCYFASSEDELEIIKIHCGFYVKNDYVFINNEDENFQELKIGEWIFYYYEDGGDYKGTHNIYTFSYLKKEMEDFLKRFSE